MLSLLYNTISLASAVLTVTQSSQLLNNAMLASISSGLVTLSEYKKIYVGGWVTPPPSILFWLKPCKMPVLILYVPQFKATLTHDIN